MYTQINLRLGELHLNFQSHVHAGYSRKRNFPENPEGTHTIHTNILISQQVIHIRIRTINTLKPCNMHTALERDSRMRLGKVMVKREGVNSESAVNQSTAEFALTKLTEKRKRKEKTW